MIHVFKNESFQITCLCCTTSECNTAKYNELKGEMKEMLVDAAHWVHGKETTTASAIQVMSTNVMIFVLFLILLVVIYV